MNLKKTVLSLFAAVAIVGSMITPTFAAPEPEFDENGNMKTTSKDIKLKTKEGGTLTFTGPNGGALFSGDEVVVSTDKGDEVSRNRDFNLYEMRAYSPGYNITVKASDLTVTTGDGTFTIAATNMTWDLTGFNPHNSCRQANQTNNSAVVGNNNYQTITRNWGIHNLGTESSIISANSGRGCGRQDLQGPIKLTVPAGTYTGSNEVTYTGTFTTSNNVEVGD